MVRAKNINLRLYFIDTILLMNTNRYLVQSAYHPDTGELIFAPGRMSHVPLLNTVLRLYYL